jgi:hypothetical protein
VAEAGRSGKGPTEEELLAALDQLGVQDVLVQALATSVSIGYRRVSVEARDLPQARLAIEALRALGPVLRESGVDEALVRDLEQARANLQLAYVAAVAERTDQPEESSQPEDAQPEGSRPTGRPGGSGGADEGDRAEGGGSSTADDSGEAERRGPGEGSSQADEADGSGSSTSGDSGREEGRGQAED